jgi:hypothetical protein
MKAMVVASLVLAACSGKDSAPTTDTGPDRGGPEIELVVDQLLYEAIAVNTTAPKNITVKNIGGAELDVESVQVAAPFETTFTLMTLQPGGAGIITVVFAPTTQGHFEEVLSVLSSDPNHPSVSATCVGETITDADGDGFDAGFDPGQDCDDANPNINPAAPEIWYNGVNDNCICETTRCSDFDQDLDGYDWPSVNGDPKNNGATATTSTPTKTRAPSTPGTTGTTRTATARTTTIRITTATARPSTSQAAPTATISTPRSTPKGRRSTTARTTTATATPTSRSWTRARRS